MPTRLKNPIVVNYTPSSANQKYKVAPVSANGTSAIRKLLRIATASAKKERREDEAGESGLNKPDDPTCQQQRSDNGSGGTEKAPLLGGEKRDAKTDHHQGDTECRTGREGGFEGDDPATTATAPNDISTLIASDRVSRVAVPEAAQPPTG